jgi:hypothetical protein
VPDIYQENYENPSISAYAKAVKASDQEIKNKMVTGVGIAVAW